jgi:benzoyl-CoA reductase/2-hydroxyglutaryl-CoA dehydratase subunit BcrC/BadD/HgdB
MLNSILTGRYDFIDYLVIPHSRDTVVMLYHILQDIQGLEPEVKLPEFYLYETLHTKLYLTDLYNRDRMRDFKKQLETWSGKEITNEALSQAIAVVNESKALLKRVAALRAAEPPRVSGVEALQLIGASMFMLKEEHNKLLKDYLEEADKLTPKDGIRLFVAGSPHDNLQFYELVESCGAVVVGEDSCWGNRYADGPVSTTNDPMTSIADRYQSKSPCPWTFTVAERVDYCVNKAKEAKAQGAVFFISEYDYTESFDYPNIKSALEENGIPTLCFHDQKYLLDDAARRRLQTGIEGFVGSLK